MIAGHAKRGFTLLEVMLSALLGAFVLLVALAAFRTLSTSRIHQQIYSDMAAQGRYVCRLLRQDLANFYRSAQPHQMKLLGTSNLHLGQPAGRLLFYRVADPILTGRETVSGDLFEVEYGLTGGQGPAIWLARRLAPVNQAESGNDQGILSKIAEGVAALSFDFYDGNTWQDNWKRIDLMPAMVRLNLTLKHPGEQIEMRFSQEYALEPLPLIEKETGHDPGKTP